MPCDDANQLITIRWMRKQFQRGKQTSGYQKRLSNRCISDGFGIGIGAVMTQIKAGDCGQPVEPVSESRYLEPGAQETRCLRPLTGRNDRKHICTISWLRRKGRMGTARIFGCPIVTFLQVFCGLLLARCWTASASLRRGSLEEAASSRSQR